MRKFMTFGISKPKDNNLKAMNLIKAIKHKKHTVPRKVFLTILFSGLISVWFTLSAVTFRQTDNNLIPAYEIPKTYAVTTNLVPTSCNINDVADSGCYSAISADGGTSYALTKNGHIDAPFQTLGASSVASATLYYDNWGTLSGTWGIYLKSARDGTTICSIDPAPENASETTNSVSCSVTTTQLSNGVWLYVVNNDTAGPENINLDYVRLYVDYTAAVSISLATDGSVAFGNLSLSAVEDTTASGINDVETVSVDSGPADLDIKSTNFTDGGNSWTLSTTNGANQVKWEYSLNGSVWSTFIAAGTLYTLDTNVANGQTRNVYLRITMPTSTNSYNQYSTTVTIVASIP